MKVKFGELKVGIFVVLILFLSYWGFNFLKGKNIFKPTPYVYYTLYDDVTGLTKSNGVSINGFNVGRVLEVKFNDDPNKKGKMLVKFFIRDKNIRFSKNSIVSLYGTPQLTGEKFLKIIPSYEGELAESGDYLKGESELDMFSSIKNNLNPLQKKVEHTIDGIGLLIGNLNSILNKNSMKSMDSVFQNFNNVSKNVFVILKKNMDLILENVNTTSLNFRKISDSLSKIDFPFFSKQMKKTFNGMNDVLLDIQSGKGTAGLLIKDEEMYHHLRRTLLEFEILLKDLKEHPNRYVHFSIFGKMSQPYKKEKQ